MDEDGHIRHLDRALVTDSIGTMCSAVLGATTATSYLECAAGVAEGGRTGLTAVTIAGLFLLALFFTPLVAMVPAYATAPVLVLVGALMMQEVVQIKFRDLSVAIPAFLTIIAMPLTFNIATGFGFGFISFVVLRVLTGRRREVSPIMYIVAICFGRQLCVARLAGLDHINSQRIKAELCLVTHSVRCWEAVWASCCFRRAAPSASGTSGVSPTSPARMVAPSSWVSICSACSLWCLP